MRKSVTGAIVVAALSTGLAIAAGPAGARSVPACGNHSLAVSHNHSQGAMGHSNIIIRFKNVSSSACSLYGYPGLDALGSYGTVLKHAKRTVHGFTGGASSLQTIVVQPGHFASADVEWMNFNPKTSGDCQWSSAIATTPANTSHTVTFPISVSLCALQVHATVAGKTGNS
ncbi:MAG TPA: DUF4232 domain-containing protein [Jatrophihabitantaceae bacterium]|jgi:hypothetical protein|nr:DUF4232 domain-containing protein [Jatrophihabitantaceae bacterium]